MLTIWALTIATVLKAEVVALLFAEVGRVINVAKTEVVRLISDGSKAERLNAERVTLAEDGGVALGAKTAIKATWCSIGSKATVGIIAGRGLHLRQRLIKMILTWEAL